MYVEMERKRKRRKKILRITFNIIGVTVVCLFVAVVVVGAIYVADIFTNQGGY
ncbi:MAG: hypothetical protein K0R00_90 [Herbinix sp.]|jgi:hypothetical protein|nr:hypothetical protein [Herbinix sp.]